MKFAADFFRRYLDIAPAALALERAIECEQHTRYVWPGPVLDVGCGDGIFAQILCAEPIDTGIDPDPAEIEKARGVGRYRELIVCFGDRIPKPDASYGTVISNSVLEHIPDLVPVLREVHRLMKPDAIFYVTIPSHRLTEATVPGRICLALGLRALARRYRTFYNRFWRHYHDHDDAGWRALFAQAGLEVVGHHAYVPRNVSTLYDFLTGLAFPSLFARSVTRRWILWPAWRHLVTAPVIHTALASFAAQTQNAPDGCLFFYALKKRAL